MLSRLAAVMALRQQLFNFTIFLDSFSFLFNFLHFTRDKRSCCFALTMTFWAFRSQSTLPGLRLITGLTTTVSVDLWNVQIKGPPLTPDMHWCTLSISKIIGLHFPPVNLLVISSLTKDKLWRVAESGARPALAAILSFLFFWLTATEYQEFHRTPVEIAFPVTWCLIHGRTIKKRWLLL